MEQWQIFKRYKIHHILSWGLFIAGWYFLRSADFPNSTAAIKVTTIKVLVLAFLVYLTNYWLIPSFLYKKRYGLFVFLFIIFILLSGIFKVFLIIRVLQPFFQVPMAVFTDIKERFYDNIIPLFLLVSSGATIKLVLDYLLSQKRLADISKEKAVTELQYLRSQINPHFVFNTLNAIYFQIDKSNLDARETLLQFSDLLRYQLYECNADSIPIEKEMVYLQDYIHLQQKRKDENYKVSFYCSPDVRDFQIVPLLLIPFVENAFKHISHFANKPNSIHISSEKQDHRFIFSVVNTMEAEQTGKTEAGGIGLNNVQRRLDLLYHGRHSLEVYENDQCFTIHLTITL